MGFGCSWKVAAQASRLIDSFSKYLLGANAMPITVLGIGAKSIFVSDEINKQNVHL